MRTIARIGFLLSLLCLPVLAQVDATYYFTDYTSRPLSVRRVTVTPMGSGADYNGAQLSNRPLIYTPATNPTLTNGSGSIEITNLIAGYAYKISFSDGYSEPSITNYFGTNVSGAVNGNDYKTTSILWSNGRLVQVWYAYFVAGAGISATNVNLIAGDNITITTNGASTWTISSSASGEGGSATNVSLEAGSNITIVTNGSSSWTISATGSSGTTYTNSTGLPGVVSGSSIGTNLTSLATAAQFATAVTNNQDSVSFGSIGATDGDLDIDASGGTITAGANTMSASGFTTAGGSLNPTAFYGNAIGLTNGSPGLATNSATATDGQALVKRGDKLNLETIAVGSLSTAEVVAIMATNGVRVFNVEKYGALPGTDSTLAISNAILAAEAVGGTVYFPQRGYEISSPLYLREQVTLLSDADVEVAATPHGTITNTGTGDSIIITNYPLMPNGIKIIGVNLTADSRGTDSVGIRVQGDASAVDQFALRDFEINGFGTAGLISNVANTVFQKVSVAYCDVGWHSDGSVNHSLTWIDCPVGEVGTGFLLKSGWAHIMGCDIVYLTNAISASGTRILLENVNMEVSPSALNASRPIGIKAVATVTSGYPTLDMKNVRVSNYSGEALTDSFSLLASNYIVKIGSGNLLLLTSSGAAIGEYNAIPSLITAQPNGRDLPAITNIQVGMLYKARPIPSDLAASGVSASASTWGDQYFNLRATAANDNWYYTMKCIDGTYRLVNILDFFTEDTIYNRLLLGTNGGTGYSGAGFTDGIGGLDVGSTRIVLGAENNSTTRGNAVAKIGHISLAPYATANPVFTLLHGYNPSGINQVTIGGGNSSGQAATEIVFRAAASVATGAGTVVGRINTSQMEIGVPLNATNTITMPTNYVAANFVPVAGLVKFVASNNIIYAVTVASTNALY